MFVDCSLLLHCPTRTFIVRNRSHIPQGYVEEAIGDFGQFSEQRATFRRALHHIDQHPETVHSVITIKQFDQCVGIGDRGRFVADHQQDFVGRPDETDHRRADARSCVNHQHIETVTDFTEGLDQACVLSRRQMHHALDA
ncbi:hypothetical protein D3C76_1243780 [compost metagenome]